MGMWNRQGLKTQFFFKKTQSGCLFFGGGFTCALDFIVGFICENSDC